MVTVLNESDDKDYLEFQSKCTSNATYKKAAAICEKYGYKLSTNCYVEVTKSGREFVEFHIMYPNDDYKPEVNYSGYRENRTFKIHTTSVGTLEIEEHDKYIEAITNANKMVKELSKLDLHKLYKLKSND